MNQDLYTPEQIQDIVENAGKTLMMLPATGTRPRGHVSSWVEYRRDKLDMLDVTEDGVNIILPDPVPVKARATKKQIQEFDIVLDWMFDLLDYARKNDLLRIYTVVWAVMPHHPIGGHQLNSFRKIGKVYGKNDRTIRRWYQDGIERIARQQNARILENKVGYSSFLQKNGMD